MAGHEWEDWFEREEFIGQISDIRVQNLQVEREVVQKRTFTRWMNLHLEKCDPPIEVHDLFQDIQDGRILMALLEELSGCKLLQGFKKSSHRIFRLNNIAKVLCFLEERNVKLVSIDAVDVADGNSSIILGLIWNIILFFQIKELTGNIRSQFPSTSSLSSIPTSSDSDASHCSSPSDERQSASAAMREHSRAIKKLLQWVQKRTRKYGVAVQDFGKSWTSGLSFLAVIKSIDSSLVDMRKALLRSARENLEDAFRIAHYSLGIPRLLEPEDVTMNAPCEQAIITYVSQFLEHFPGTEEPEDTSQLIERSVSMGRLNFRDANSELLKNGVQRGSVKERSSMFQRDAIQAPPRILTSSISEDRGLPSPSFRAAARSWSSEDVLDDPPHVGDVSSSVPEEPKVPTKEVSTSSESPQPSSSQSPTGSSVPESVNTESLVGDSAIGSPDSWLDSASGGKFGESRSDSSLCDSGTAWEVYRATPVDVTPLDEGPVPSITDSYTDEGIYSLSSLESSQGRVQGPLEENLQNQNQDVATELVPDQSEAEIIREVDSEQTDVSQLQKDQEQEPSFGPGNAEVPAQSAAQGLRNADEPDRIQLISNTEPPPPELVETNRTSGQLDDPKKDMDVISVQNHEGQTERQETGNSHEDDGETQDQASEGLLRDDPERNTLSANQEGASERSPVPSMDIVVPLISISSEPEEPEDEEQGVPERQEDKDLDQGSEGTDPDVKCPISPDELSRVSTEDEDKVPVENPSCPTSENGKPALESEMLDDADGQNLSRSSGGVGCGTDTISEDEQNRPSPQDKSQAGDDPTAGTELTNTERDTDSADMPEGHRDKPVDTVSGRLLPSKTDGPVCGEPAHESRNSFYTDSPPEDLVGDLVEPMDLFYPDKEEPMFTEPLDSELQSWPSVLSVSALQPAPTSQTTPENQQLEWMEEDFRDGVVLMEEDFRDEVVLMEEDFRDEVVLMEEQDQLISETVQEASSESQQQRSSHGDTPAGRLYGHALSDLREAETQSPVSVGEHTHTQSDSRTSIRPDEVQIAPILRHRKGARFAESKDAQRAAQTGDHDQDAAFWCSEIWELHLLLLLWLLLYCFMLLPQMDLKTLPGTLLNLHR
ncbi:calmin isoform X2 [Embiotoca jacksoni]|uniref:calmin isoform X2 n=1 Tax=Embiotoca jacksoni TaxID=100190 RepID=UPI00370370AE